MGKSLALHKSSLDGCLGSCEHEHGCDDELNCLSTTTQYDIIQYTNEYHHDLTSETGTIFLHAHVMLSEINLILNVSAQLSVQSRKTRQGRTACFHNNTDLAGVFSAEAMYMESNSIQAAWITSRSIYSLDSLASESPTSCFACSRNIFRRILPDYGTSAISEETPTI